MPHGPNTLFLPEVRGDSVVVDGEPVSQPAATYESKALIPEPDCNMTQAEIVFHNTLSGKKETFVPSNPEHISIYVCGPTVYNFVHIGNGRPAVVFDADAPAAHALPQGQLRQ